MKIKRGRYKVLKSSIPVAQYWTCGDGCCSEWETYDREVDYAVGTEIYVTEEQMGPETYETGSDYEGHHEHFYRPLEWKDYVAEGYLEPLDVEKDDLDGV